MADVSTWVRQHLLKPLSRRQADDANELEIVRAVTRVQSIAQNARLPANVKAILEDWARSKKERKAKWKPEDHLTVAHALYDARLLSTHEYVFYVSHAIGEVLEDRRRFGQYKQEFDELLQRYTALASEYGLAPDEYFPLDRQPQEFKEVDDAFGRLERRRFAELLAEFGFDELASLFTSDESNYERLRERGRRNVFHRNATREALRDAILNYESDAKAAAGVGAYSAAIASLGAAIEGTLIERCLKSPQKAARIATNLSPRQRPKKPKDPTSWFFPSLIEVCRVAGWLPKLQVHSIILDSGGLAERLKSLRNLIHPGRLARERPWALIEKRDFDDAWSIYAVLRSAVARTHWRTAENAKG